MVVSLTLTYIVHSLVTCAQWTGIGSLYTFILHIHLCSSVANVARWVVVMRDLPTEEAASRIIEGTKA